VVAAVRRANLAATTLKVYATMWDPYVLPRLGHLALRELTLLQGVLQRACEWERLSSNPARAVRKPSPTRRRSVRPLAPETVETMRHWLLRRDLVRDATLVSVLAYAGLRPSPRVEPPRGPRFEPAV